MHYEVPPERHFEKPRQDDGKLALGSSSESLGDTIVDDLWGGHIASFVLAIEPAEDNAADNPHQEARRLQSPVSPADEIFDQSADIGTSDADAKRGPKAARIFAAVNCFGNRADHQAIDEPAKKMKRMENDL